MATGITTVTWNPQDLYYTTLSNNNKTVTVSSANSLAYARANVGISKGKYYWEFTFDRLVQLKVGVSGGSAVNTTPDNTLQRVIFSYDGNKAYPRSAYATSFFFNSNIGVALDMDLGTIEFYIDGVSKGVAFSDLKTLGEVYPFFGVTNSNISSVTIRTNTSEFMYSIPSGFKALDKIITVNNILLLSNNKIYSLKSNEILHETKMTSNTAPAPFVASASSQYSTTLAPFRAFNGINTDANSWATANNSPTGWIQIDYGLENQKLANVVYVTNRNNTNDFATSAPKDFNILGSNDGVKFDKIAEIKNQTNWTQNETRKFRIIAPKNYRYYRLEILSNNGATYTAIGEILYALEQSFTELPTASESNFIKYGANSPVQTDMIFCGKNYILTKEDSEIRENVRSVQINRKPLSIKLS